MDIFLKAIAGILIAIVVCLILAKENKDFSTMLIILVCCMVSFTALQYIEKIIEFLFKLETLANLDRELLQILFKAVGIGLISEITIMICVDSGNASFGKVIQILSSGVILWICIPLFEQLLDLVDNILGAA